MIEEEFSIFVDVDTFSGVVVEDQPQEGVVFLNQLPGESPVPHMSHLVGTEESK
jgi:hypothetical protein